MSLSCCPLYFQVYLQHLQALLSLSTFTALWLTILDFMDKYMHADQSDQLVSIVLICLPCCHNVQFLTNLCDITGLPIFSSCLSPSSIVINFKPSPWSVLCMFCKLAHFRVLSIAISTLLNTLRLFLYHSSDGRHSRVAEEHVTCDGRNGYIL